MLKKIPTLHLLSGLPASGKSTYAKKLRRDTNGAIFSLDQWLTTCFKKYSIESVGYKEHTRRVVACRKLILEASRELLKRDIDVILDDGFFLRKDRNAYQKIAKELSAGLIIYYFSIDLETIKTRTALRNKNLPRHNFIITPKLLEKMSEMFEKPQENEGTVVRVGRHLQKNGYEIK